MQRLDRDLEAPAGRLAEPDLATDNEVEDILDLDTEPLSGLDEAQVAAHTHSLQVTFVEAHGTQDGLRQLTEGRVEVDCRCRADWEGGNGTLPGADDRADGLDRDRDGLGASGARSPPAHIPIEQPAEDVR